MEFGTREILLILGIVVIVGILLDGFRRVRHTHSGSLKVGVSRRKQGIFDDESVHELPAELPTGEVRVTKRDVRSAEEVSDSIKRYREKNADKQTSAFLKRTGQDTNVVPFQSAPPRDRYAEEFEAESDEEAELRESQVHADCSHGQDIALETEEPDAIHVSLNEFDIDDEDDFIPEQPVHQPAPVDVSREPLVARRDEDDLPEEEEFFGAEPLTPEPRCPEPHSPEPLNVEPEEDNRSGRRRPFWEEKKAPRQPEPEKPKAANTQSQKPAQNPKDVIILHVMARKGSTFGGSELLESMLANNLRYGSMRIFHRHEHKDGSGVVLFSLANSVNPGTFDLGAMEGFTTPGVAIFMPLEGLKQPLEAYKELIRTAQNMAKTLDGAVQDDTRSVLTNQTIEHYRQQIIEYTRRSFTLTN